MTNNRVKSAIPSGIKCRRNGQHTWDETGDAGIEIKGDAALYIRFKCLNNCGGIKTRRWTADGVRATWEESAADKITYTDPSYLLKKTADEDIDELKGALQTAISQAVVQMCDPKGTLSKPTKKTPAKKTAAKKVTAKTVTAKKVAEAEPLKRASERKPAARTSRKPVEPVGGRKTAAKQPTSRRAKQSA